MNNADYHADTSAISASGLKLFARSPAHYWAAYLDPNREPQEPTPAMKLGTAVHCAILEPGEFDNRYVVLPEGIDRRTKEGKALFADLLASGKEPLPVADWNRIKRMSESFHASLPGRGLFAKPHLVEQSVFATINGVSCKARPDFITTSGLRVMDVKTTTDARPESFGKSAWSLGYHIQAAFYRRVLAAATGITPDFVFGCVESAAPHLTAFYELPASLLDYADSQIDELLDYYAECLRLDSWPGYHDGIEPLPVPGYAQRIIDDGDGEVEVSYA